MTKPKTSKLSQLKIQTLEAESKVLEEALRANKGLWVETAQALGVQVSSLQRALARHPKLLKLRIELASNRGTGNE